MATSPFEQIQTMLARLTAKQKMGLIVAGLLTTGAVWGTVLFVNRISYEVLFSNLEPDDANAIVAKLQEEKVSYRIDGGGGVISVPSDRVADLRLSLAGEGIPRGGGIGFEIFDRSNFDTSDFVQNVNYQRALERELGRTIEAIDVVSKARVHLVLAPRTLFIDENKEAKASVVLKLRGGRDLRSDQAMAIANLVSSAVTGLDPKKVSIVDTEGKLLKDGQGDEMAQAMTEHQLDMKTSYERDVTTKLITLLTPIVGEGRVRARVDAKLNFQKIDRIEEKYDPEGTVVVSETKNQDRSNSSAGGGAPGTPSNLPTGTPVASAGSGQSSEGAQSTTSYAASKTTSKIMEPVGEIERLSIAVVIDNAPAPPVAPPADGTTAPPVVVATVPRSEEEMRKLTQLVRAAIGFSDKRGDVLTVENLPFDPGNVEAEKQQLGSAEKRDFWLQVAKYPSMVLGGLLIFLLIVRPVIKTLKGIIAPPQPAPGRTPAGVLTAGKGGSTVAAEFLGASEGSPGLTLRRKLIEVSSSEPEGAAHVVRAWLKEV